jgi:hypothetical protein
MDKINDFYEFRLMCLSTEKQTREALGLPKETPPPAVTIVKTPIVRLFDINEIKNNNSNSKVGRTRMSADNSIIRSSGKRGLEDYPEENSKKTKTEPPPAPTPPPKKYKISCAICVTEFFEYQSDLQDHLFSKHTVSISKYGCASCRETFNTQSQSKEHDLMHSRTKLPYTCFKCSIEFPKQHNFNRHIAGSSCKGNISLPVTQEDIKCFQCKKKFITQYLFEWHGCFLKSKSPCPKCGKFFQRKPLLFKHYVLCNAKVKHNPNETMQTGKKAIKAERGERTVIDNISNMLSSVEAQISKLKNDSSKKKGKKGKAEKKGKNNTVVKSEIVLEEMPRDEAEAEDEELYNNDDGGDFHNYSDHSRASTPQLPEPEIEMGEKEQDTVGEPTIRIKQEQDDYYGDKIVAIQPTVTEDPPDLEDDELGHEPDTESQLGNYDHIGEEEFDHEIVKNIKKEKDADARSTAIQKFQERQQIELKLRIKQEKGTNANAHVLNPAALGKKTVAKKRVFKIPKELAIKIKREKLDPGYGDRLGNGGTERDEAEPESDEDLNGDEENYANDIIKIKQEKLDPGYGDVGSSKSSKSIRINPMALLRDKNSPKGPEDATAEVGEDSHEQEIQIPVISGVSSIALTEEMLPIPGDDENPEEPNEDEQQSEVSAPPPKTIKSFRMVPIKKEFRIENIRTMQEETDDFYDEFNDAGRGEDLQTGGMVQIPQEFQERRNERELDTFDESQASATSTKDISMEEEERLLAETDDFEQQKTQNQINEPIENIIDTYLDDMETELSQDTMTDNDLDSLLNDKLNEIGNDQSLV